jgi:hypothetical protein
VARRAAVPVRGSPSQDWRGRAAHVPDDVIDALRKRERVDAMDPPNERRRKYPGLARGCRSFAARLQGMPGFAPGCRATRSPLSVQVRLASRRRSDGRAPKLASSANHSAAKDSCEISVSINENCDAHHTAFLHGPNGSRHLHAIALRWSSPLNRNAPSRSFGEVVRCFASAQSL